MDVLITLFPFVRCNAVAAYIQLEKLIYIMLHVAYVLFGYIFVFWFTIHNDSYLLAYTFSYYWQISPSFEPYDYYDHHHTVKLDLMLIISFLS